MKAIDSTYFARNKLSIESDLAPVAGLFRPFRARFNFTQQPRAMPWAVILPPFRRKFR